MLNLGGGKNGVAPTLSTPILFLIFNRPDTTQQVFNAIRKAQPKRLYIAADGPRLSRQGESELCEQTRAIIKQVDWDCEIKTLFRDENLGCGLAVSSAISWFFEQEEEGIILEDDCLPSPSFFTYCEEMLQKYRNDTRIMMVSGSNYLVEWKSQRLDYFFSMFGSNWGWASWRRAWQAYDYNMQRWANPEAREAVRAISPSGQSFAARYRSYTNVFNGHATTWDFQWAFCRYINSGLTIMPSVNLISNIGFGDQSTHTSIVSRAAALPLKELTFPLRNNPIVSYDREFDKRITRLAALTWKQRLCGFLKSKQKGKMLKSFIKRKMQNSKIRYCLWSSRARVFQV
ncbi:MAG: nucleotide-diphospho-sugar transferase [Prevotellaceae bacterium]|nr:nucleotide-diphospho-sugar transferase [Prevotellaceae bacterium]